MLRIAKRKLHHSTLEKLEHFHKFIYKQEPQLLLDPNLEFFIDQHLISSNAKTYRLWINSFGFLLRNVVMEQRVSILSCAILQDPPSTIPTTPRSELVQIRWQWEAVDKLLKEHTQEGISVFVLESLKEDIVKQHYLYFTNPPRMIFDFQG